MSTYDHNLSLAALRKLQVDRSIDGNFSMLTNHHSPRNREKLPDCYVGHRHLYSEIGKESSVSKRLFHIQGSSKTFDTKTLYKRGKLFTNAKNFIQKFSSTYLAKIKIFDKFCVRSQNYRKNCRLIEFYFKKRRQFYKSSR